jgi:hypothetical protein
MRMTADKESQVESDVGRSFHSSFKGIVPEFTLRY